MKTTNKPPNADQTQPDTTTLADVHVDSSLSPEMLMITRMISSLSTDMRSMFGDMNNRINSLESNLERKITQKVNQIVDKRISSEVSKISTQVKSAVDDLRQDFDRDLKVVEEKVDDVSKSALGSFGKDISCNLVIRNLPESINENVVSKASALMREGLKLKNISFSKVERKASRNENKSELVIVTCKSRDDSNEVMSTKRNLKSSRQYSDIFIHKDQTVQQRIERKNFQVIVDVLKSVDPYIDMKGAEVIAKRYYDYQNPKRNDKTQNTRSENGHNRYAHNERRDRRDTTNRNTHNRGHNTHQNSDNRQECRDRHGDSRATGDMVLDGRYLPVFGTLIIGIKTLFLKTINLDLVVLIILT